MKNINSKILKISKPYLKIRFIITRQKTWQGIDSMVIPRELSRKKYPLSLVFSLSKPSSNLLVFLRVMRIANGRSRGGLQWGFSSGPVEYLNDLDYVDDLPVFTARANRILVSLKRPL